MVSDWRRFRVQFSVKPFYFDLESKPSECRMQKGMTGTPSFNLLHLFQWIEHRRHREKYPDRDRFDSPSASFVRPSDCGICF